MSLKSCISARAPPSSFRSARGSNSLPNSVGFLPAIRADICQPLLQDLLGFLFIDTLPQQFRIRGCLILEPLLGQPVFTVFVIVQSIEGHPYSLKVSGAAGSNSTAQSSGSNYWEHRKRAAPQGQDRSSNLRGGTYKDSSRIPETSPLKSFSSCYAIKLLFKIFIWQAAPPMPYRMVTGFQPIWIGLAQQLNRLENYSYLLQKNIMIGLNF